MAIARSTREATYYQRGYEWARRASRMPGWMLRARIGGIFAGQGGQDRDDAALVAGMVDGFTDALIARGEVPNLNGWAR